jgi:hypothetical protein
MDFNIFLIFSSPVSRFMKLSVMKDSCAPYILVLLLQAALVYPRFATTTTLVPMICVRVQLEIVLSPPYLLLVTAWHAEMHHVPGLTPATLRLVLLASVLPHLLIAPTATYARNLPARP